MRRMAILLVLGAVFVFSSGFVIGMFMSASKAPIREDPPPDFKEQKLEPVKEEVKKGAASRHEKPEAEHVMSERLKKYSPEVRFILSFVPGMQPKTAEAYVKYTESAVDRFHRDPHYQTKVASRVTTKLMLSLMAVESGFNWIKRGSSGELGLCQIIPKWHEDNLYKAGILKGRIPWPAEELGLPGTNIEAGVFILMSNAVHSNSIKEALAKYNAGNNVRAGMPYAHKVLEQYSRLAAEI